jgi:hypothetical protein
MMHTISAVVSVGDEGDEARRTYLHMDTFL